MCFTVRVTALGNV